MKRKERHLDAERQTKRDKQPELQVSIQWLRRQRLKNRRVVKRSNQDVKRDDRDQHQQTADGRVNEKFDCRVNTALAAPDSDEEKHRHQRRFEEQVEEQQVE